MLRIGLTALALLLSVTGRLYAADAIAAGIHLPVRMYCAQNVTDLGWLVRDDKSFYRPERAPVRTYGHSLMQETQVDLGRTQNNGPSTAKVSGWKQAGIYGLEFAGAAVGTSIAAAGAYAMLSAAMYNRDLMYLGLASYPTYAVSGALFSAGGTHIIGKMVGHGRPFSHALVGGAIGGISGAVLLMIYTSGPEGRGALVPVGLVLPPLCAVVAYNVW